MRSTLILLALVASAAAHAIQPEGAVGPGVEPQRVFRDHPQVQARLADGPAFRAFREDHPTWRARFDEVTGAPWQLWGGPIPVPSDDADTVARAVRDFAMANAELLRIRPEGLTLRDARYIEHLDTWLVDFETPLDGAPIWRGGLTARIKRGNLVMVGVLAYGDRPARGSWTLDADAAIASAIARGPAADVRHDDPSAERVWLPVEGIGGLELVATWLVRTRTTAVPGKWVHFVDATTGELLSVHNEVRFADGAVTGWHAERTVDGSPLVSSPIPAAWVSNGADAVLTELDGGYSIADGPDYTTDLNGDYLEVTNTNGPEGVLTAAGPELEWTTVDATQAEISTYVFLHQVRAWGASVSPDVHMVEGPIRSNVNVTNGTCNAYFDGEVNFYASGGGCANTGQIADVNYHEWGHGFHLWSVNDTWNGFDGSLSEGAADTVAFFQTRDSTIAPHFFNNGGGIRNVSPDRRYPEDYTLSEYAVHDNGLIFGGAMWDLWNLLKDLEGEAQGTASAEEIFAGLLRSGPGVADSYEAAIFSDDDDGDLANGTPHECAIIEAFGLHGLGPLGSGDVYVATHAPLRVFPTPELAYPIEVGIESSAPNCFGVDPVGGSVHFRTDGGDWQSADLSVGERSASGAIPAQPIGSFVEYYLRVEDASGAELVYPSGAEINPFSYYNGPVLEVLCEDFEKSRGRFKHELVSGQDGDGADDWQWGVPGGKGGDPSGAFSGDYVWGNDLGWDEFNGEYQSDKKNRLFSPVLDTHHYLGGFLTYQRWLTIEDGVWDRAVISADGQKVWANVKGIPDSGGSDHVDRDWAPQAIDLGGAGDDGSLELEWSLESDGGVTFGGWNIDDVCVFAPDTLDNRLGVADFGATRRASAVELTWTNPRHEPATGVVVVRSDTGLPTGPDDGVVVFASDGIELGATAAFVDTHAPAWDVWYAVYGTDGKDALSWTREGFNGGLVEGTGARPAEAGTEVSGGCRCSSTGGSTGLAGLVLALGLAGVRRRRPVTPA